MKTTTGSISTLISLVQINHKRLSLYKKSADKGKDIELKLLFMRYAVQSQGFINALNRWIIESGGSPVPLEDESSLLHTWSRIKESLTSDSRNMLLHRCELCEEEMLKIYSTVVSLALLPVAIIADLNKQANEIELACYTMKGMQLNVVAGLPVAA